MSDDVNYSIAVICGIVVFVYLLVNSVFKGKTKGNKLKEKALRDGTVVKGHVIKNIYRRNTGAEGRYRSETVIYEYIVEGKAYKKKVMYYDTGLIVNYPNEVDIYYQKGNPSKAYAGPELLQGVQKQTGCYQALIIPVVVIILVYNLLRFI